MLKRLVTVWILLGIIGSYGLMIFGLIFYPLVTSAFVGTVVLGFLFRQATTLFDFE